MQDFYHIIQLIYKYKSGDTQASAQLEEYYKIYPNLKNIVQQLKDKQYFQKELNLFFNANDTLDKRKENELWRKLESRIQPQVIRPKNRYISIFKYSAAAAILIFATVATWKFYNKQQDIHFQEQLAEIKPGTNKALLRLPNGKLIELSDQETGLTIDSNLVYSDGSALDNSSVEMLATAQLELITPKGGQYQVTLADNTKVWLNADSKLSYPKSFTDSVRTVVLEGEAYFEVAKNAKKPFLVKTANETVRVLGTHFNVESYRKEVLSRVSLNEGKVQVSNLKGQSIILKPGYQALNQNATLFIKEANLNEVLAWKNGEFLFENSKLEDVMQSLSRWYDFEYELGPELKNIKIWAMISRQTSLAEIFKIIKYTDKNINIQMEEGRIIMTK